MQTQRKVAADSKTKPTDFGCESTYTRYYRPDPVILYRHLIVLVSPKADTYLPFHAEDGTPESTQALQ